MSVHQLRSLERQSTNDILLTMISEKMGFKELLLSMKDTGKTDLEDVRRVLVLVAHVTTDFFSPENLIHLLQMILQTQFLGGPVTLLLTRRADCVVVDNVLQVIKSYQEKLPSKSLTVLPLLLPMVKVAIAQLREIPPSLRAKLTEIEEENQNNQRQFQKGELREGDKASSEPDAPNDFRRLSVIPLSADIQPECSPFVRKNRVTGSYKDANDYLDVQFRLLREDCVRPLREGIREFLKNRVRGENRRLQDIQVYEKARILEPYCGSKSVCHLIEFDVTKLKHVKWETTKRLINGSLLCFSKDDFKTAVFGTIAERNIEDLAKGRLYVQFEGINIQLVDCSPYDEYVMVESGAYFESYVHNLKALGEFNNRTLPFKKYLLCGDADTEVRPPRYLINKPTTFDFTCLVAPGGMSRHKYSSINPLTLSAWPSLEEMGLDTSQYRAVQTAITKEFSVIQGPPGTGKTFIGLKICRLLLENKHVWLPNDQTRPILVVCYTNHALDQFLEGILEFMEPRDSDRGLPQLARLGGRTSSENPKLQQCLLHNIRSECGRDFDRGQMRARDVGEMIYHTKLEMRDIESQIEDLSKQIEASRKVIVPENFLDHLMTPNQRDSLLSRKVGESPVMSVWLLEHQTQAPQNQIFEEVVEDDPEESSGEETDEEDFGGEEEMANRIVEDHGIRKHRDIPDYMQGAFALAEAENGHQVREEFQVGENTWTEVKNNKKDRRALKQGISNRERMSERGALGVRDVWALRPLDRWRLYHYWMAKFCEDKMMRMRTLQPQYETLGRRLGELEDEKDYRLLRGCAVIGMTTTGAAKYRRLVRRIEPLIAIVEEAAEVLEAHIITSLNPACQHVILIGDHQQLKPNPTVYKLATEYNLNVSLFERMVKNKMHCDTLTIQHRMRPEIAELIVPHIYDHLENHQSVTKYENIMGVQGNLFFISHKMAELSQEDTRSHSNVHEAEFLVSFYEYLLKQGYEGSRITILTLYTGQMFAIRRLLKQRQLEYTRVTPVDNYQGEENDIVLLSLVRSNEMGSIGFLRISNRVCVALSRAKKGFYVIGNMTQMQERSRLWNGIIEELREKKKVVESLPLTCQNHPDTVTLVKEAKDFRNVPEGGCMKPCDFRLECGHVCIYKCHPVDREHNNYECNKPCSKRCKTNGDNGHFCRKLCFELCGPCKVLVKKIIPQCSHEQMVPCHQDPETFHCTAPCEKVCHTNGVNGHPCLQKCYEKCKACVVEVSKTIPDCGHVQNVPCSVDPADFKCQETCNKPCSTNLPEPHLCQKRCFEDCGVCKVKVNKVMPSCSHLQVVPCHQNPANFVCSAPCERKPFPDCDHLCPNSCGAVCAKECTTKIVKKLPCGHDMPTECHKPLNSLKCIKKVEKVLPCEHKVKMKCSDDLSGFQCQVLVKLRLACSHEVTIPCHRREAAEAMNCEREAQRTCLINKDHKFTAICSDHFAKYMGCKELCQMPLGCGHQCRGKCGECLGRHHPVCSEVCGKLLPCSHRCKGRCGEPCPPCQQPCSKACAHKVCRRQCGQLCEPCRKECPWTCAHHPCDKRCNEECDKTVCDEQCPEFLHCARHRCIGFCGEPCPPVCKCNVNFARQVTKGAHLTKDTRLVQVFPCRHVVESSRLETWLQTCVHHDEVHVVGPVTCPLCHCRVSFCPRFGSILQKNKKEHDAIMIKIKQRDTALKEELNKLEALIEEIVDPSQDAVVGGSLMEEAKKLVSKNARKQEAEDSKNWILAPSAHLKRLFWARCLQGGNPAVCSDAEKFVAKLMSEKERKSDQTLCDAEVDILATCILRLHKTAYLDTESTMEAAFSLMSGIPPKSAQARGVLKTLAFAESFSEKCQMQKLTCSFDALQGVKKYWSPDNNASTWLACGKGTRSSWLCLYLCNGTRSTLLPCVDEQQTCFLFAKHSSNLTAHNTRKFIIPFVVCRTCVDVGRLGERCSRSES